MISDRHQLLIALLIEGRATVPEQDELADAASADPGLLTTLRQQLALDEVLSQLCAPERSGAAFLEGLHERERVSRSDDQFVDRVRRSLATQHRGPAIAQAFLLRAASLAVAASVVLGAATLLLGWLHDRAAALEPLMASTSELAGTISSYPNRARRALHDADGMQ